MFQYLKKALPVLTVGLFFVTAAVHADTLTVNPDKNATLYAQSPDTVMLVDTNGLQSRGSVANGSTHLHSIMSFTMPIIDGTITQIDLTLRKSVQLSQLSTIELYRVSQDAWTESGATWNKYDGTNTWTTGGGDIDTHIVDVVAPADVGSTATWNIYGGDAINPIAYTWGQTVDLLIKNNESTTGTDPGAVFFGRGDVDANKPYITITYTPSGSGGGSTSTPPFSTSTLSFTSYNQIAYEYLDTCLATSSSYCLKWSRAGYWRLNFFDVLVYIGIFAAPFWLIHLFRKK